MVLVPSLRWLRGPGGSGDEIGLGCELQSGPAGCWAMGPWGLELGSFPWAAGQWALREATGCGPPGSRLPLSKIQINTAHNFLGQSHKGNSQGSGNGHLAISMWSCIRATGRSKHLQLSKQRQHPLLSCSKTLSVGPAEVETQALILSSRLLHQMS